MCLEENTWERKTFLVLSSLGEDASTPLQLRRDKKWQSSQSPSIHISYYPPPSGIPAALRPAFPLQFYTRTTAVLYSFAL